MKIKKLAMISVFVSSVMATGSAIAQEMIKFGFNGDLSASPSAQSGQAALLGVEAAIEDINKAGGVMGKKLSLVVRDDVSAPPKSIQNMSELIDNEKVVAVFGPTNSGNALAWKHLPNQKKVISMGVIGGGTDITKPTSAKAANYMFRVSMVDREQAAGLMAYVKKSNAKKVGVMAETTGFGSGGLKDIRELAELQKIDLVQIERFGVNDTDMSSQLMKMRDAKVDTLIVWAQGTPLGLVMRSMEKINYHPQVITSWAADNVTFYDAAGKNLAENPIFMRTMSDELTPKQKVLFDRVKSKLVADSAFPFTAHGYDAVLLMTAAIKQAGTTTDGEKIRIALEDLKQPVDGYMKTYSKPFTAQIHEALTASDFDFIKWKNGKLVTVEDAVTKSITPADILR